MAFTGILGDEHSYPGNIVPGLAEEVNRVTIARRVVQPREAPPEGKVWRGLLYHTGETPPLSMLVARRRYHTAAAHRWPEPPGRAYRTAAKPTGEQLPPHFRRYVTTGRLWPEPPGRAWRTAAKPTGQEPPPLPLRRRPVFVSPRFPFPGGQSAGHRRVFHTGETAGAALAPECPYLPARPDLGLEPTFTGRIDESQEYAGKVDDGEQTLPPRIDPCR